MNYKGGKINKNCMVCGSRFEVFPYLKNIAKYCSKTCQHKGLVRNKNAKGHKFCNYHKNVEKMTQKNMGNKYTLGYKHTRHTKEKIRKSSAMRWKNPDYRKRVGRQISKSLLKQYADMGINNKTEIRNIIRNSFQYKDWRDLVYKRDGYTCVKCGKSNCELNAHHKMAFTAIIRKHNIETFEDALKCDELWDIDNGQTLCIDCHQETKKIIKYIKFGKDPVTCYLSGYINEKHLDECKSWRRKIIEHYNNWNDGEGYPIIWLDPMNGEIGKISDEGMFSALVPGKALYARDYMSVKEADFIVVNLDTFGGKRPMIGTIFEMAWAKEWGKPIIVITTDKYFKAHPFIYEAATAIVSSVEELLNKKILNYLFKGLVSAETN